jgi:predicted metal-binding membrane protein
MPEHSTMSMMWMRMPGQTWAGVAMSFLAMWIVMTAAMMLPSLVPTLWRYRQAAREAGRRRDWLTTLVAGGYFFVWTLVGATLFPFGVAIAAIEMRAPSLAHVVPMAGSVVIVIAGVLQLSAWKARRLAFFSERHTVSARAAAAWRHGLSLGLHCAYSCAPLMAIVFVIGIMDIRAMAVATLAITVERLPPSGARVARAIGGIGLAAGLFLIVRAVGLS